MAEKTKRYLVTLNSDDTIQSFYIIRDEKGNKFLLESLGSILFEIIATGTFRVFDPDDDIQIQDFFEYDKEDLGKYQIFDFQKAALGFICRQLVNERRKELVSE
jgi:hypothetical protein